MLTHENLSIVYNEPWKNAISLRGHPHKYLFCYFTFDTEPPVFPFETLENATLSRGSVVFRNRPQHTLRETPPTS